MKVKLNAQAIRVAERLLKKPFSDFDLSDEGTMMTLLYAMVSENNEETFTLKTFKTMMGMKKMAKEVFDKYTAEMEYVAQFNDTSSDEEAEADESPKRKAWMGEIAAFLIQSGMSAEFVLYRMKMFEISDYMNAIEASTKEQMESDRLWTFLSVMPHIHTKKGEAPPKVTDLFVFPWEQKEIDAQREIETQKGDEMFKKFINSKPIKK